MPKVRALLTAQDREALHRQAQQQRHGTVERFPVAARVGASSRSLMDEARQEAKALNLPDWMTLEEIATRWRYPASRHAPRTALRRLERVGAATRIMERGNRLLVPREAVIYAELVALRDETS